MLVTAKSSGITVTRYKVTEQFHHRRAGHKQDGCVRRTGRVWVHGPIR